MTQWLQNDDVKRFLSALYDYGLITVGALIVAANVPLFLQPNHVISSGITGIGMLLNYRWGLPIGMATLAINLPLLLAGTRWGGGLSVFFVRTVYAVAVLTIGIDLLGQVLPPIPSDPLIYTLFGGLLDGLGIGLVLRGRGTTGGTDIIAQLVDRYTGIPFGMVFVGVNGAILLATTFVVGIEPMLYALVVNFISGRVVDVVQEGISYARACMIVTSKEKEIRRTILEKLDRGVTVIEARGGYTEAPRPALYVVVSRAQVTVLKRMIADIDPRAFVVVTEAHEVLGEGFRPVTETS
jgi:uncharacterized membrane-anchored protein YitT (DUF2179 family)